MFKSHKYFAALTFSLGILMFLGSSNAIAATAEVRCTKPGKTSLMHCKGCVAVPNEQTECSCPAGTKKCSHNRGTNYSCHPASPACPRTSHTEGWQANAWWDKTRDVDINSRKPFQGVDFLLVKAHLYQYEFIIAFLHALAFNMQATEYGCPISYSSNVFVLIVY